LTKDEALKLALEALEYRGASTWLKHGIAVEAIKEALAQPAQKPVAWGVFEGNLHDIFFTQAEAQKMAELKGSHAKVRPLYTAPPQRPWVGLTDEEIDFIVSTKCKRDLSHSDATKVAQAIETALRSKNT